MGTVINGAGSVQNQSAMAGTLTIKNANNSSLRMASVRKTENKQKKALNYNHREISGQLLRAKKAQSAGTVLTRAKSKLANLQRAAGSGQYDSKEVANAIAHARRMVRCAQLKVRNLRQEEQEQKSHQKKSGETEQQKNNEVKRRVSQKERALKNKVMLEEVQEVSQEKRKRNEMVQKRRMHRNQERSKINEADMKYIKAQLQDGKGVSSYSAAGQGAVLDLSMEAAAMAEVQRLEMMTSQQLEAEIEAEVEAEIQAQVALEMSGAAMGANTVGSSVAAGTGTADAAVSGGDAASTVNVSI